MPVSNLSPWQDFLSKKFPGRTPFTNEQLAAAADEFFGPIPIPPGSTVVSRSGAGAEYVDAQGYRHVIRRQLDGRDPQAGQIQDNTDRPANLPTSPEAAAGLKSQQDTTRSLLDKYRGVAEQQAANAAAVARGETPAGLDPGIKSYLDQIAGLSGRLQGQPEFAQLSPEVQAALDQISQAEQARLADQFNQAQGTTIAQLYGNRTNQSTIGNDAIARLLQSQGIVSQQQLAQAAARNLQTRQFLTEAQRANNQLALQGLQAALGGQLEGFRAKSGVSQAQMDALNDLLKQFTAQQTQRDIAEAGLAQEDRALAENRRQADLGFQLNQQNADAALAAQRGSFARNLLSGLVGAGLNVATGGLTGLIPKISGTATYQAGGGSSYGGGTGGNNGAYSYGGSF